MGRRPVIGIGVFLASEFTVKAGEVAGIALAAIALGLIGWAASRPASASQASQPGHVAHEPAPLH